MVGRTTLSPKEWEGLVAEWRESGMSRSAFAKEHGVPATALSYWVKRLETSGAATPTMKAKVAVAAGRDAAPRTALARVVRPGEAPPFDRADAVRVLVGKAVIVVEPGFDDVHLRAVVRALAELG